MLGDIFVSSRRDALRYERLLEGNSVASPRFELLEWKGITDVDVSVLWSTLKNERYDPKRHQLVDLVFHSHATAAFGRMRMKAAVLIAMTRELLGRDSGSMFLFAFPPELVTELAKLSSEKVPNIAKSWLQELDKPTDRTPEFIDGLTQICNLATIAKSRRRDIYLWFGV